MSSVDRDPYFPPVRFGGVPTGSLVVSTGSEEQTYGQLVAAQMAARWGSIPSGLTHDQVLALVYPSPFMASVGDAGGPYAVPGAPTMALSAEQEAYIAKVRSELHSEWAAIREQEAAERGRLANIAVSEIRSRGPIVFEGPATAGEYSEDAFTVGGKDLDGALFYAEVEGERVWVDSPGRVRITVEFLEDVTDV